MVWNGTLSRHRNGVLHAAPPLRPRAAAGEFYGPGEKACEKQKRLSEKDAWRRVFIVRRPVRTRFLRWLDGA